jgi:hypothetical protein
MRRVEAGDDGMAALLSHRRHGLSHISGSDESDVHGTSLVVSA